MCLSVPGRIGANTAPRLTLNTSILPATYNLTYGTNYTACAAGIRPTLAKPCEPGCTADDQQNGNLTSKVIACPSSGCRNNSLLCSGRLKLIQPCCFASTLDQVLGVNVVHVLTSAQAPKHVQLYAQVLCVNSLVISIMRLSVGCVVSHVIQKIRHICAHMTRVYD